MVKKHRYFVLVLILSLLSSFLVGCGAGEESNGQGTSEGSPDSFKVGLLIPGSINDGGWSSSAYKGLLAIEEDFGAEISYMQVSSPSDVVEGFRDYASKGYDIVFGHSYDYQDAAARVAPEFPNTIFITSGGTTVMDNVSPIYTEFEQATYLMGVVAAKMSKTGKIGSIGSEEMPAITKSLVSFEQGVTDTNPNAVIQRTYLGTQDDIGKAKEATLAMIDQGVDIFWVSANAAGQGALQAVEENKDKDIKIFGAYARWSEDNPDVVIADGLIEMSKAFSVVAERVKNGKFEPGEIPVGIKDGVILYLWNEKMEIPQETMDAFEKAKAEIAEGKITIDIGAY